MASKILRFFAKELHNLEKKLEDSTNYSLIFIPVVQISLFIIHYNTLIIKIESLKIWRLEL